MKIFEWFDGIFKKYIKAPIDGIQNFFEDKIGYIAASKLAGCTNVEVLNMIYNILPSNIKETDYVRVTYNTTKEQLTKQGLLTKWDAVLNPVSKGIKGGVELVTKAALENLNPLFKDMQTKKPEDLDVDDILNKAAASGEFGLNAVVGFMLGHFLSPILMTSTAPAWEAMGQEVWKKLPVRLLDEGRLLYLIYRFPEDAETYREELKHKGYSDERIKELEKAFLFYPSPHDLIHWQAKEVFEPKMIKKYGLENELENVVKEPFYKSGMDDEQIRNFWIAHWEHPSWTVIRQMLFRTDLTEEDVWDWFKTIEIPPFWRDKYIKIGYSTIGRIDLRRLYSSGEIDYEALEKGYRHLGYSPSDAEKIALWTDKEYAQKDKDIAMGKIMKGYNLGEISAEICLESLVSLGYDENESKYLIALEDYSLEEKRKEDEAETLVEEVINGTKTLEDLETGLKGLLLRPKEISKYRDKAKRKVRALIKQPTEAKLTEWVTAGFIDIDTYRKRLAALRYGPEDVENFIKGVKGK